MRAGGERGMTDRTSTADSRPTVRLLSLSAGVQNTAVWLLASDGVIRRFDYALVTESPGIPHLPQEDQRIAPPGIRQP
jgi:hypothetical protein